MFTVDISNVDSIIFFPWSSPARALATPSNSHNPKAGTGRIKYCPSQEKTRFKTFYRN